ncbi:MAG: DNA repair protein RecO [Lachnospiraceae bacterium]|nr:DNA repair protein RecO [Lachnospiraceae bacterium]
MQTTEKVTGIILKAEPIGEYDKRVVILTGEKGKIAAFAKGARLKNSRLLAATNPFCFGTFTLFHGRSSYSITEAEISNFFAVLREDYEAAFYGMYFLEVMDYYTHENIDEKKMLNLLYQSLKAVSHPSYENQLVRYIFEIKALVLNGEYPGVPERAGERWSETCLYTLDYIANTSIEKLYNFTVSSEVIAELATICAVFRHRFIDKAFKGQEILDSL